MRPEHLTQKPLREHEGLLKLQEEFKEMEEINKDAGWYDRNKNGKQHQKAEQDITEAVQRAVDSMKELVDGGFLLDVGKNAATVLGIAATKLHKALVVLKSQGYKVYYVPLSQKDTNLQVTIKVLAAPGTSFASVMERRAEIFMANGKAPREVKKRPKKRPARPTRKNEVVETNQVQLTNIDMTQMVHFTPSPMEDQAVILARLERNLNITTGVN